MKGSKSENDCQPCPAGYLCQTNGLATPSNCPLGSFCPANSATPLPCPVGTYGNSTNLQYSFDCQLCPNGKFNSVPNQVSVSACFDCSTGTYCPIGSATPTTCPSNYYCPDPTQKITCPIGTSFSGTGAYSVEKCKVCEAGFSCAGQGANAIACPLGSYSPNSGSSDCLPCPAGYACDSGTTVPVECPVNTIATKGSGGCTPCPQGQFTKGPGESACITCPSSRFTIDGWWCMTPYEKLVFLAVWIGSIASFILTVWKIKKFVMERVKKLKIAGVPVNLKSIVFIKSALKNSIEMTVQESENDDAPMISANNDNKIKKLEDLIINMQKEIDFLKNK